MLRLADDHDRIASELNDSWRVGCSRRDWTWKPHWG